MPLVQGAEDSVTYAELLSKLTDTLDEISWGPAYSDGTRVMVRSGRVWRAFLISDLTAFTISRAGSLSLTIPANGVSASANVTISPALNDPVLTNWLVYATAQLGAALLSNIPH